MEKLKHGELTKQILEAFYKVYHVLGYGFMEKVYENSLGIELRRMGLQVTQQAPITVYYTDEVVGEYFAVLLIANAVIVEIKAGRALTEEHKAQLLNYLRATPYEVGWLFNFGSKPEFKRKVYDNPRKTTVTWVQKS